ncbi:glycosyltransferase [Antarcticibacterium flavum]|uniref:Glycosyltransferase n=1 Tax=Antarcticibacterium flavum TaxID=2058175 RepID=A0A5B7X7I4_9FLAO|nr:MULTISPECIES: glycosyltransferase [Antarcticibacterium]MCM4161394.1 glycosyl transferase family 2 [Antarcticibacterium sp. W02-3]QCY70581.1 glycosyltransferase [Antarcticibacterium flavum]
MKSSISIIYAYRNREIQRIRFSMESLKLQSSQNFEVIFVDYGSNRETAIDLEKLLKSYSFVKYIYLPVENLLWNKSKALNYGILQSKGDFIFIADVDLIFHPEATALLDSLKRPDVFQLFKMGYLDKEESQKLKSEYNFKDLKPSRIGDVNGMILAPKHAFIQINGFDEFFHFYGAEDEDLFARLENAGYKRDKNEDLFFYHNWHRSFSGSENELLTTNPRLKNIMRINQQHFHRNRDRRVTKPLRQEGMGKINNSEKAQQLEKPNFTFSIPNILAQVEHFLREEIPTYAGEIIHAEFYEDPYFSTFKHKTKNLLGKQSQPYCSLKEVNDRILQEILFNYRDYNYSFRIQDDLKRIIFKIQM